MLVASLYLSLNIESRLSCWHHRGSWFWHKFGVESSLNGIHQSDLTHDSIHCHNSDLKLPKVATYPTDHLLWPRSTSMVGLNFFLIGLNGFEFKKEINFPSFLFYSFNFKKGNKSQFIIIIIIIFEFKVFKNNKWWNFRGALWQFT